MDFVCENEEILLAQLRELVLMLPFNQEDVLDYDVCEDDLNRKIADYSGTGDAAQVLKDITDVGRYVEVTAGYAREMVTAFVKLNGLTVGAVANRTEILDENGEAVESFNGK